jgi:hypothetical protein
MRAEASTKLVRRVAVEVVVEAGTAADTATSGLSQRFV